MTEAKVTVLPDRETAMEAAAFAIRALLQSALESRPRVDLALAGGTTPADVYRLLAQECDLPWERVRFWFGDERAVTPDHPDSNYRMACETLFRPLAIRARQVHRMEGEAEDLGAAAIRYARTLPRQLDLLLLGIGEDGHIASLFPGSPALLEKRRVVATTGPKPPPRRLTITPPVVAAARDIVVVATGLGKAVAAYNAVYGESDPMACPAVLARRAEWILDGAAGAMFPAKPT